MKWKKQLKSNYLKMLRNHLPFFLSYFHICILYDLKVQVAIKKYVWLLSFYGVSESVVCICVAFNHHSPPPTVRETTFWSAPGCASRSAWLTRHIEPFSRRVVQQHPDSSGRYERKMRRICWNDSRFSFLLNRVTQFFVSISFWKKKNINHVYYTQTGDYGERQASLITW